MKQEFKAGPLTLRAGDKVLTKPFGRLTEGHEGVLVDKEAQRVWAVWLSTKHGSFLARLYEHEFVGAGS